MWWKGILTIQASKTQLNLTLCEENWKTEKQKKQKANFYFYGKQNHFVNNNM